MDYYEQFSELERFLDLTPSQRKFVAGVIDCMLSLNRGCANGVAPTREEEVAPRDVSALFFGYSNIFFNLLLLFEIHGSLLRSISNIIYMCSRNIMIFGPDYLKTIYY